MGAADDCRRHEILLEFAMPAGSEITRFPRQLLETCPLTGIILGPRRDGDMNAESIRVLKGSQEVILEDLDFLYSEL